MRIFASLAISLCCFAPQVYAQQSVIQSPITQEILPLDTIELAPVILPPQIEQATLAPKGVMLRALDKVSGEVVDFELTPGQTKQLGRIQVSLNECRYPTGNPAGDATAHLIIRNAGDQSQAFSGWMIASSPALNGLDHSRYDVWVLRCITS
ncbi:MAG: DUF2155 domain-containing protein [Paracoccaceae bacterium]